MTSTFYAVTPFIGALLSFVILSEKLTWNFVVALAIMMVGTYFAAVGGNKE
jgi:drug/metabolite transporter (DMT)-like permease